MNQPRTSCAPALLPFGDQPLVRATKPNLGFSGDFSNGLRQGFLTIPQAAAAPVILDTVAALLWDQRRRNNGTIKTLPAQMAADPVSAGSGLINKVQC